MAYRLPPLTALRAFEAAARTLSFKKAAAELHVTPAAISHQVKALEGYLGVPLFRRLTRRLELTAKAEAMLPKLREAFACLAAAVETTRDSGGALSVSAPPTFAARWLVPRLPRFAAAHPEVELRLSSSPDTIDRHGGGAPGAGVVDPRDPSTDVAIRFGSGRSPGQRVDLVLAPAYTLVCSPRLLVGKRPLRVADDLRRHVLIHDETIPDEAFRPSWEEWLRVAGATGVDASLGPRFGNAALAVEAALDGQGVVLALKPLVAAEVAAGRLVIPFDVSVPSRYVYYLATPEAIADRPAVAAFRAWLLAEAAAG